MKPVYVEYAKIAITERGKLFYRRGKDTGMSEEQISSQTSDTPPPFAAVWFAVVRGEKQGPLTVPDVGALMEQGTIERHTLMWKAGMAEWRPAGQLPELDLFSTASKKRSAMDDERIQRALEVSKHSSKEAFEAGKTFVVNPLDGVAAPIKRLERRAHWESALFSLSCTNSRCS